MFLQILLTEITKYVDFNTRIAYLKNTILLLLFTEFFTDLNFKKIRKTNYISPCCQENFQFIGTN